MSNQPGNSRLSSRRELLKQLSAAAVLAQALPLPTSSYRTLVVAGSDNRTSFAVIDFTNVSSPQMTLVNPGFNAGVKVALDGTTAATGSGLSGLVRLADLSGPVPVLQGSLLTSLSGIGSIAVRGGLVAVGESVNLFKARVSLIDFSQPATPTLLATVQTPLISVTLPNNDQLPSNTSSAISNIAFVSDRKIVISGQSDFRIFEIDFANVASPVLSSFFAKTGNAPVTDVDGAKNLIAAGDSGGRMVKFFNALDSSQIASVATSQASINSLSLSSAGFALATGSYSFTIDKIEENTLTSTSFSPGLSGGLITAVDNSIGACGEINGTRVALLDFTSGSKVVSVIDSTLASISTLAVAQVAVPVVAGNTPRLVLTPNPVIFPMTLRASTAVLEFQNTGGSTLTVSKIGVSDSRFYASTTDFDVLPGETKILILKFSVSGGGGQYIGIFSCLTNDPAAPRPAITLLATVGVH